MVIAHTGDWHFGLRATNVTRQGFNQRELDVYQAGEVLVDYLCDVLKPDIVVIAGDVYQSTRPDPLAIRHVFTAIKKLQENGIIVVVVGGNHDTPAAPGRESPLLHLRNFFGAELFLEQESKEIGGVMFHALPYRALSQEGEPPPFEYSDKYPNVLISHATVDSPLLPSGMLGDLVQISMEQCDAPELSVTLLGHIHIHKKITEKGYYCGSIERLNFGEIKHEPAIWVHTIGEGGEVQSESVKIADMGAGGVPRPVRDIILDATDASLEEIAEAVEEELKKPMSGALVRLTVNQAPRALRGSGLLEQWRRYAYDEGHCFFIEVRVRSQEMAELLNPESTDSETSAEEALRIEPEWRVFLEEKGRLDLLESGLNVIREAKGES